jgi:hypothetical protein
MRAPKVEGAVRLVGLAVGRGSLPSRAGIGGVEALRAVRSHAPLSRRHEKQGTPFAHGSTGVSPGKR